MALEERRRTLPEGMVFVEGKEKGGGIVRRILGLRLRES